MTSAALTQSHRLSEGLSGLWGRRVARRSSGMPLHSGAFPHSPVTLECVGHWAQCHVESLS